MERYSKGATKDSYSMPSDLHEALESFAKEHNQSKSRIITEAVASYLLRLDKERVISDEVAKRTK
jgi:predicted transcriptional regulator